MGQGCGSAVETVLFQPWDDELGWTEVSQGRVTDGDESGDERQNMLGGG